MLVAYTDEEDKELSSSLRALQRRLVGDERLPGYVIVEPQAERPVRRWGYKRVYVDDPPTFLVELKEGLRSYDVLAGN